MFHETFDPLRVQHPTSSGSSLLNSGTLIEMSFTRSAGTPPPWYGVNPIQTGISSNYTAQPYDYYIGVNGTGVTVTLPLGSSVVQGKTYVIKDESGLARNNSAHRVTIAATSPNTLDGSSSVTITQSYTALTFFWTGTFWSII